MTPPSEAKNTSTERLKLHLSTPFRSLREFPDVELPNFTLLTGVNGVGKTHLLKAINDGAITVEGIESSEILYFDWSSLYNLTSSKVERSHIRPAHSELRREIAYTRSRLEPLLRNSLSRFGVPEGSDPWIALRENPEFRKDKEVSKIIAEAKQQVEKSINHDKALHLVLVEYGKGLPLLLLDDKEIEGLDITHAVGGQAMQVSDIGKVGSSGFSVALNLSLRPWRVFAHHPQHEGHGALPPPPRDRAALDRRPRRPRRQRPTDRRQARPQARSTMALS